MSSFRQDLHHRRRDESARSDGADWTDAAAGCGSGCAGDPFSALAAIDIGEAGLLAFAVVLGAALIAGGVPLFVAARRSGGRCLLYSLAGNAVVLFGAAIVLKPFHRPELAHDALLGAILLSVATLIVWGAGRRRERLNADSRGKRHSGASTTCER